MPRVAVVQMGGGGHRSLEGTEAQQKLQLWTKYATQYTTSMGPTNNGRSMVRQCVPAHAPAPRTYASELPELLGPWVVHPRNPSHVSLLGFPWQTPGTCPFRHVRFA